MVGRDDRFYPVVPTHCYEPFGREAIDAYFEQQAALGEPALGGLLDDLATIDTGSTEAEAIEGARRALEAKDVAFPASLTEASLARAIGEIRQSYAGRG